MKVKSEACFRGQSELRNQHEHEASVSRMIEAQSMQESGSDDNECEVEIPFSALIGQEAAGPLEEVICAIEGVQRSMKL